VTQLSKYVLDYAPHTLTAAGVLPLPGAFRLAPRVEYKHRTRSTGAEDYTLLDARVGRRFGAFDAYVEATNLLNEAYEEIAAVPMPGRAVVVSFSIVAR
jgi:outer membrane receptor protein involved in Fe transport